MACSVPLLLSKLQSTYAVSDKNVWKPKSILSVTILNYKNLKFGWFSQNKPFVTVHCPWPGKNLTHSTLVKYDNPSSAVVNERFQFIVPDNLLDKERTVEITVLDQGRIWNRKLESFTLNASELKNINASAETTLGIEKTFELKKGGELNVKFLQYVQQNPEFRLSADICEEEKRFRKRRMPKVKDAIQTMLKNSRSFSKLNMTLDQTPVISVVGSGGGYRAAIGMSGGMAALKDAGVLDTLTYAGGLSGSAWYLCSAYAQDGVRNETQDEYHKWLQQRMRQNVYGTFLNIYFSNQFSETIAAKKTLGQRHTLVDYFGYALGKSLLSDHLDDTLTHIRGRVADGEVPYPVLSSAYFKDHVRSNKFHVLIENTPHEISMPRFGVNIATEQFGSHWDEGVVTRECPEFPLHHLLGSCGCAFSVLLNAYFQYGFEVDPRLPGLIDKIKCAEFSPHVLTLAEESRQTGQMLEPTSSLRTTSPGSTLRLPQTHEKTECILDNRNLAIDRTAKVNNFLHNYGKNLPVKISNDPDLQKLLNELEPSDHDVPDDPKKLSVCDAGIVQNVNVEAFLRKSRISDLIIVFDMNLYKNDKDFDYMPVIQSALHASKNGLPFPKIQIRRLVHEAPAEFLTFEGYGDDCPTILWFTLCNKSFKAIENYEPKIPYDATVNDGRPFNDFPVFSDGTNFETFKLEYSELHFQQLHELMYHNVTSCMPYIKHHIGKAVERKIRREEHEAQNDT